MSAIRPLVLGALVAAALAAVPTAAHAERRSVNAFGVDGAFVLPLSDYGDYADFAVGALGRLEFGVAPHMWLTGRIGFLYDVGTPDTLSTYYIPIYGGLKASLSRSGLFGYGELGVTVAHVTVEILGTEQSDSESEVGLTGGLGFQSGQVQARVGLWFPSLDNADDALGVMANLGFDIAAL
jgi:hypothetical protein